MNAIALAKEDIYRGSLVLVNRRYPLHESEGNQAPDERGTESVWEMQSHILLERTCAKALRDVLDTIKAGGQITGVSGFRTLAEQTEIFQDSLKENGREFTETYVAYPGHSEHQTGLAIDLALNSGEIDFICPDFPDEGICRQFRQAALIRGFIERYPAGREAVTGIGAEPWHFRYVGVPHAQIMGAKNMVLEEYIQWLKAFLWDENPLCAVVGGGRLLLWETNVGFLWEDVSGGGEVRAAEAVRLLKSRYMIGYLPCGRDTQAVAVSEKIRKQWKDMDPARVQLQWSGNNVDGFIITAADKRCLSWE